jgi:hypothetical protein
MGLIAVVVGVLFVAVVDAKGPTFFDSGAMVKPCLECGKYDPDDGLLCNDKSFCVMVKSSSGEIHCMTCSSDDTYDSKGASIGATFDPVTGYRCEFLMYFGYGRMHFGFCLMQIGNITFFILGVATCLICVADMVKDMVDMRDYLGDCLTVIVSVRLLVCFHEAFPNGINGIR